MIRIDNIYYNKSELKHAFKVYLQQLKPDCNEKTISTYVGDSMFVLNSLPEISQDVVLSSFEWDDNIKERIIDYLIRDALAMRVQPRKDALGYLRAFHLFFDFVQVVRLIDKARVRKPREVFTDGAT
jgi:hypothetical protein